MPRATVKYCSKPLDDDGAIVSSAACRAEAIVQRILPPRRWTPIDFGELLRYRELLYFLVWRDFQSPLQTNRPRCCMGAAATGVQHDRVHRDFRQPGRAEFGWLPVCNLCLRRLLPWTFFASGVNLGGLSLVNQQHLLTKVYFPRLFVPTAAVGIGLVDMLIAGVIYAGLMVWFQQSLTLSLLALPGLVLLLTMATLGFSYLLAALTVSYRDFRFVIPFMMQAMMYISPVVYPVSMVPDKYQWVLALNPMAGIIDGFRSALLGKPWNFTTLAVSAGVTVVLFLVGMFHFRRTEQYFADIA
jgi:lipopolysaccharide transport system permease protein